LDEQAVLAGGLESGLAVRAGVIGGDEGADNELSRLDGLDVAANLLDEAAVLMPYRGRLGDRVDAAVGP
jgi:hypothetical protein